MGAQIFAMTNETKCLLTYFNKLETEIVIPKDGNEKLLEQLVENYQQCLALIQQLRREYLNIVDILSCVGGTALKDKVFEIFQEIEVAAGLKDIQSCHCFKIGKS